ncbi:MAG TPA: glycosyltransferase family 4 protein [Pyrinomonadaceae bacterium]|nr:glycosyltransferase family 4 protein [Pyrinomonadaceae bacterium]
MRVFGLASYPVEAAATRFRMIQFIEPLAEQGIELSVHPFLSSRLYGSLYKRSQWPRTSVGLALAAIRRLQESWRASKADVLFVQREAMMFGPPIVEWLSINLRRCPMVLDLDDATYVSYKSPTYGRFGSMLKWFSKTNDLIRWSRLVICGNGEIAAYVTNKGRPAVVIPTVVDTSQFRPVVKASPGAAPLIGWIGTHSTFPYVKTIFPVLERLARKYRFRLRLVGTGEDNVAIPGVEIENLRWKLDREIADFQSLDIGIYPIVEDDWSVGKSCFKAVQYMAVGVPFVASPVGACQNIADSEQTHFLARTENDWYAHLSRLLSDEGLRRRMGEAGRSYAEKHYSVEVQVPKLAEALRAAKRHKEAQMPL